MKRLLLLGPQEIQSGVYKGVDKAAVPLWAEGNNVAFKRLGVQKIKGTLERGQASSQVRDIVQAYVAGQKRAYLGTNTGIQMLTETAGVWAMQLLHNWITAGEYADLETWGTWVIGTNGVDPVITWKNGVLAALAGTTFTKAKVIKRKTPFLMAFNTSNGDTMVEWSSDSNPELWTPSADNKARNYTLRDLDSEILAAEDIGDRIAVYSRSTMVVGQFVGGDNVFGWRRAISGIGAVSRRSVVTVDPFNYGLTKSGIFKTDGNSFTYVDDPAMVDWLIDTANWNQQHLFWGFHDQVLKCVTWYFLDVDSNWNSISYFYDQGLMTRGDLQLTAGAGREVFSSPVVASPGAKVGMWQEAEDHFGVPVAFSIKTKPLDFGERSVRKLLQLIRVDGTWEGTNLRVAALDEPEGTEKIVFDKPLVQKNYFEFEAPYFTMELYGSAPMSVSGIEFMGQPGGLAL